MTNPLTEDERQNLMKASNLLRDAANRLLLATNTTKARYVYIDLVGVERRVSQADDFLNGIAENLKQRNDLDAE